MVFNGDLLTPRTNKSSRYEKYPNDGAMESHPVQVNFNTNLEGRIHNPLAGIAPDQLLKNVESFANAESLKDILPLLKKGALVARDPSNYEDITGPEALCDLEIEALRDEVLHKWRQPAALYVTIVICSIGAAVQGWDQTGALMGMPR